MSKKYKEIVRLFKNSYLGDKKTQIESEKTLKEYWKSKYGSDIFGISKFFNNIRHRVYKPKSNNEILKNIVPAVGIIDGEKRIIAIPKDEARENYDKLYNDQEDVLVSIPLDGMVFASKDCCVGSGSGILNFDSNYQIKINNDNLDELLYEGYRALDLESSLEDEKIPDGHLFEHMDNKYGVSLNFI